MKAEIWLLDSQNKLDNDVNLASFCLAPFYLSDKEQDIPLVSTGVKREQKKYLLLRNPVCRLFSKIQNLGQISGHVCVSGVGNALKLLSGKLSYLLQYVKLPYLHFHVLRKASSGLCI